MISTTLEENEFDSQALLPPLAALLDRVGIAPPALCIANAQWALATLDQVRWRDLLMRRLYRFVRVRNLRTLSRLNQ
jgi:hypothetical protein